MTDGKISYLHALKRARAWLTEQLTARSRDTIDRATAPYKSRRSTLAVSCAIIFLVAFGVRLLHWQDSLAEFGQANSLPTMLVKSYSREVARIREDRALLFPSQPPESGDARMILHPPGYSILMAAIGGDGSSDKSHTRLRWLQIICDSAAAVLVMLIAVEFFPLALAIVAGSLVAFSPHLSFYSLWLTPESLAALPVLVAVYLIARSINHPRLWVMIAAGALIGLSCWLRSNSLLLALFLAAAVFFIIEVERRKRLLYSASLVVAMIVVISPITIRNWAVYHRFIPLSLGAGITMIEGIADYDDENRFGMPASDEEVKYKDAEWHNRPDYEGNIWVPDGVERDHARFRRGLEVARSNPVWFAGVMIRRAVFMLSYNGPVSEGWPFDTAHVPPVSLESSFGHNLQIPADTQPVWASSAAELKVTGNQLAPQSVILLSPSGQRIRTIGDATEFGDQFASAPIVVEKNTDYVLRLAIRLIRGPAAAKVTSADRRIALASSLIVELGERLMRKAKKKSEVEAENDPATEVASEPEAEDGPSMTTLEMPFATGNRTEVLVVLSNNGASTTRPMIEIGQARLYRMGPTPHTWTRIVRPSVRGIQRNLYKTSLMLPLVIAGIILLAAASRKKALVLMMAVPVYYLLVQSAFHTEYRYILVIHYFLFIMAAITLYCAAKLIGQGARWRMKKKG